MAGNIKIFKSYFEATENISPKNFKIFWSKVFRVAFEDEDPDDTSGLPDEIKSLYVLIKPTLTKSLKLSETRAFAGRKGLEKRWGGGDSKTIANDSKTIANELQTDSKTIADIGIRNKDKGIRNKDKGIRNKDKGYTPLPPLKGVYVDDPALNSSILEFLKHRKKLGRPMTDKAVELFIQKLDKLADDNEGKIALIETAILRGWMTVYPPKEDNDSRWAKKREVDIDAWAEKGDEPLAFDAQWRDKDDKEGVLGGGEDVEGGLEEGFSY